MAIDFKQIKDRSYKNSKGQRTHKIVWRCTTDDPYTTGEDIVTASNYVIGVDTVGSSVVCVLQDIDCNCVSDDGMTWEMSLEFTNETGSNTNPLNEPYEYEVDMTSFSRIVDYDINNVPIVNTAGDFYSDPVEVNDFLPTLSATGNHLTFNFGLAYAYRNAVNSDNWNGFAPGTLQVLSIKGTRMYQEDFGYYWKSTYQLMMNPDGFDVVLASRGLRERDSNGKLKNIKISGKDATEPVLLDAAGKAMLTPGQPVFSRYQVYPRLPFNGVFVIP